MLINLSFKLKESLSFKKRNTGPNQWKWRGEGYYLSRILTHSSLKNLWDFQLYDKGHIFLPLTEPERFFKWHGKNYSLHTVRLLLLLRTLSRIVQSRVTLTVPNCGYISAFSGHFYLGWTKPAWWYISCEKRLLPVICKAPILESVI